MRKMSRRALLRLSVGGAVGAAAGYALGDPLQAGAVLSGTGIPLDPPPSAGLKPAVIVVRHFMDLPNPPPAWPGPFCYDMPHRPPVPVPWRRLADDGVGASVNYGVALPDWIASKGLCPISRVIAQDPRSKDNTQNPFDTLYPLIWNLQLQDVVLYQANDLLKAKPGALLPDNQHSTCICWDRQTLWGDKDFSPSLFLGRLRRGDSPSLAEAPAKAPNPSPNGIYVFTDYSSGDDKFDLRIHPTLTKVLAPPPGPRSGTCAGS
jgi:hypothetical protein